MQLGYALLSEAPRVTSSPGHPIAAPVRRLNFRDHDVLLFDASLDGVEAPNSVLDEHGLFANLHPQAWFLPFEDDGQPRRGV